METQYWLYDATTRRFTETNFFKEQPESSVDFAPTIDEPENNAILSENSTKWIDNRTEEVLVSKKVESYKTKIVECVKYLRDRALVSSISKESDIEYLKGQAEVYTNKYKVAHQYCIDQTINDIVWYKAIEAEMINSNTILGLTGTENELTIPTFMSLIKEAYEKGLERSKKFEPSIEIFRCKAKDLAVTQNFSRCDVMLEYGYNLSSNVELSEVDSLVDYVKNI